MAEILKFVQTATVFDPEFIHVLATAFDNAWNKIAAQPNHDGELHRFFADCDETNFGRAKRARGNSG